MITATLIITCVTLVIVAIGLYISFKSTQKTLTKITNFEESLTEKVEEIKAEILTKIQDSNNTTISILEAVKINTANTIWDSCKVIQEELIKKATEININNYNTVETSRKIALDTLESKIDELKVNVTSSLKESTNESIQNFQNLSKEINSKIESSILTNEKHRSELFTDVTNKFNLILEEIKNPLTLD